MEGLGFMPQDTVFTLAARIVAASDTKGKRSWKTVCNPLTVFC